MKTTSVMIVGVGGQGSLLASKLLGRLLVDEGLDVKVIEMDGRRVENVHITDIRPLDDDEDEDDRKKAKEDGE